MISENLVILRGRLTADPVERYGAKSQSAVVRFTVAIDNGKDSEGNSRGAEFPGVVAFGKLGESVMRRGAKGAKVYVRGKLHTGSYEKDGCKIYFTEVIASAVDIDVAIGEKTVPSGGAPAGYADPAADYGAQQSFEGFFPADDIPF